mmetsp:Transcript_18375/g.52639  ORF Transcript_18375/g.52639 Transcript_18375/m.52639 type:complete len:316 (-) Transcript_18375:199-1146(-)
MMCAAGTPARSAVKQHSTFGIIPPEITPSAMSFEIPSSSTSRMRDSGSFTSRSKPGTSVIKMNSSAPRAPATAAAAVSALMFKRFPSASAAQVATMGTRPASKTARRTEVSTPVTSPTKPSASFFTRSAFNKPASTPPRPTACTPAATIVATIRLFTFPMSTMDTTSMVAASVTRRPLENCGLMPTFANHELISGPPPCTRTGRSPKARSVATSRIVRSGEDTIAAPPYLTTTVRPRSRASPGRDSASPRARTSRASGGNRSASAAAPPAGGANLISPPVASAAVALRRQRAPPARRRRAVNATNAAAPAAKGAA